MIDQLNTEVFRSHGKLLLTGEYLVLKGAESLSLPLRKGQSLDVRMTEGPPQLNWTTYVNDQYWFDARYSLDDFVVGNTNDFPTAMNLRKIFLKARELNPSFLKESVNFEVTAKIEFDINWGFGSSSSLIANIAKWSGADPFKLHFSLSEGSGYDIATALLGSPVLYKLSNGSPEFRKVNFDPVFKDKLFFAYLGKKRKSSEAIKSLDHKKSYIEEILEISTITRDIQRTNNLTDFVSLLKKHDKVISGILNEKPVNSALFYDFNGYVKSLGAWGGDFALIASDYPLDYLNSYLKRKGIHPYFSYNNLIIEISGSNENKF